MKEYKRLTERRGSIVIDKCSNCENVRNPQGCTDKNCYEIMKNRLAELEFAQRYVYGRSYKKETWSEYLDRKKLKELNGEV